MMEGDGGASIIDVRAKDGKRQSVFRSYVYPMMDRENLTVLTGALVLRLDIEAGRATGVTVLLDGAVTRFGATKEIVLSLGAIHTPKLLMQSGIGDELELQRHGIPVLQHAPGVGKNFQDHIAFDCIWEYLEPLPPRNNMAEATFFWKSDPAVPTPDIQACLAEVPKTTPENAARYDVPQHGWTLFGGLMRPKSRGQLSLTGPNFTDPVEIEANFLSHPDDLKAAITCVELCREVGNAAPLRAFSKREVMPGRLKGAALEDFVRAAATTYWHETCTAKMGTDAMSVVNGRLQVYGIQNLRIADGSIMPRVTTGNTMAPCVIIGERAAEELSKDHGL
jgi:choline dehydrogenase